MKCIPTRIVGVAVVRAASQRPRPEELRGLSHEPVSSEFSCLAEEGGTCGFTSQLCFNRRGTVERRVRCTHGEVFLAVADLRLGSPTFGHWQGFYLRGDEDRTLHIPAGVASGWQVTSPKALIEIRNSCETQAKDWRWLPWHDLTLAIDWPSVPDELAAHSHRIRSLAMLPNRALPKFSSPARKASRLRASTGHGPAPRVSLFSAKSRTPLSSGKPKPRRSPGFTKQVEENRPLILVIGSNGQLGRDLCRHLRTLGTVVGACRKPDRASLLPVPLQIDVSRPASVRQVIRRVKPALIVNACGLTDLEKAELEPRTAQLVNATAPAIIADEAKKIGASLVHFCTDMVFDGNQERPWRESDVPHPINQYARTKLLGTNAIRDSGCPHLAIRTGWLYSSEGHNYLTQLVDLLTYRNAIHLASDHYGTPTSTDWLARVTAEILSRSAGKLADWLTENGGLVHVAPLGYASRLEVGDQVVATCRAHALPIVTNKLRGVPLASLSNVVRQPANCRLDCSRLALHFGVSLPRWQADLVSHVSDLLGSRQFADQLA